MLCIFLVFTFFVVLSEDRIILNVWHGNQGDLEASTVILEVRDPKLQNITSTIRNWLPFGPWVFVPD